MFFFHNYDSQLYVQTNYLFQFFFHYLNESKLFRSGIDFYYEFTGRNSIHIECAMKNPYLDEYFYVECVIKDGIFIDEVDKKFKGTIFDRMNKKIMV